MQSSQDQKDHSDSTNNHSNPIFTKNPFKDDSQTNTQIDEVSSTFSSTLQEPDQPRKKSIFSSFRRKSNADKETKQKEKRESMSERGPFRIEMRNGVPITVENRDWPPGTQAKTSSLGRQMSSKDGTLGGFYSGQGGIVPGGETAGNVGPDPDWVPGLSEEEKEKLRSGKSGRYVF